MSNLHFWCDNVEETANYCYNNYKDICNASIACADDICNNIFLFKDHWEMERTQIPVHFENEIDWAHIPADDIEWIFALNRHTIFVNLGKAWRFTGNEKYAQNFVRLLTDWLERVPLTEESSTNTWRSLEAGLRCENWLRTMRLFENSPLFTAQLKEKMEQSLLVHGDYLEKTYNVFHKLSNWGVLQDHGLFLLGVYFNRTDWCNLALQRLDYNLHLQVMDDGTHWEQSPMYHCEVLHCAIDVVHIAHQNNIAVPEQYMENVHRMCTALAKWLTPTGRLVCQSDSDDTDARDLVAMGALLFNDNTLKGVAGSTLFVENLWDFGTQAVRQYNAMQADTTLLSSIALPDSGNYMLRENKSENAAWLHMHCGCLGSGHGHADLLHVDIVHKGECVLQDSGRYTYVNTPLRRALKLPAAHNTVRVDNTDFSECVDSWGYSKLAQPIKGEYKFTQEADYISGAHVGYMQQGVFVQRKVLYIKPSVFVLFDVFYTEGTHSYEQYFHFGEGTATMQGNNVHWQGNQTFANMQCVNITSMQMEQAPYSTDYNALKQGDVLHTTHTATGFTSLVTVIGLETQVTAKFLPVTSARYGRTLPEEKAQALQITCNETEYTIIASHGESISEVDLLCANEYQGYGKMLLFSKQNPNGTCFAW